MKDLTSKSEQKFKKVMHEFGQGELKSHGEKVTDQRQALAIAFSQARKIYPEYGMMKNGGGITGEQAAVLAKIYKTGTAKQLWEAWTPDNRTHFLMDHAVEFFELMGDDYTKSSNGFAVLSYDTLSSPIKKSVLIHHAQGMYAGGGGVETQSQNKSKAMSPAKKKLLDRINTLKAANANAGAAAQKSIQKKIDVLQKQFDYNPSAKEKARDNKGKFALDVPASYSKAMYKKLWAMKVFPRIHKLNGTHSIVVSSKVNLDKAYEVYSDMLKEKKEKFPALSTISRKL